MVNWSSVEKLEAYLKAKAEIEARLDSEYRRKTRLRAPGSLPAITISRQAGARGVTIGTKLATYLQKHDADAPWTLLDKDLVERVLKDHHLPTLLAQFIPEDMVGEIESTVGEILGRHPSVWSLLQKTTQTILKLGRMGHVILVGRGSNIITAHLNNVVHVRLVGSLPERTSHLCQVFDFSAKEAREYIKKEDGARKRYLKKNFDKNIDDPLLYDLVVNTDRLSNEMVVEVIADLVLQKNAFF